jgi:hypothetical protein
MTAPEQHVNDQDQYPLEWYSRRDGVVRGPFTAADITRYLLLGRIRLADELSKDATIWSPADSFTDMLPPEVTKLTGWDDYQQLVEARMQVDERKSVRRCQQSPNRRKCHAERRRTGDRRRGDENWLIRQYIYNDSERKVTSRTLLLTLLLATVLFTWLYPVLR